MFSLSRLISLFALMLSMLASPAMAAVAQDDDPAAVIPLRLSYIEGDVSFWRYGADDWTDARRNTPLAAGDALYVDGEGSLELQMASRAFIRASDDTQVSLVNQSRDFLQLKVTSGRVSFDMRTLPADYTVEVDTPNAVFTIDRSGYYRVEVNDEVHFITRRGGQATMVPAGGKPMSIYPSEEIVVSGTNVARAETYVAPELDGWDKWNYERTEDLLETASERYLSPDIAGADDLDRYGRWRVVADYGAVWVPDGVAYGWAPYSTGHWVYDPYYQWTWIDDAPWGWAPFHYGRWVYVNNYWAWAPGPIVRRAVYAPALVAFYGVGGGSSVSISIGGSLGWVALSWGEPVVPWWGRPRFIGRPYWGGWGGPRVVNNVVVKNVNVINVTNITYVNTRVNNAVVGLPRDQFNRGYVQTAPGAIVQTQKRTPIAGALPVQPGPTSVAFGAPKKARPPDRVLAQPVVATRTPHEYRVPWRAGNTADARTAQPQATDKQTTDNKPGRGPEQRFITVPKSTQPPSRPQFGEQSGDERPRPQQPPGFGEKRRQAQPQQDFDSRVHEMRDDDRTPSAATPDAKDTRQMPQPRESRIAVPEAQPRSTREDAPRIQPPERERGSGNRDRDRVNQDRDSAPDRDRSLAPPSARNAEPQRDAPESQRAAPEPQRAAPEVQREPPSVSHAEHDNSRGREDRPERQLPGNAANRMYRGEAKKPPPQHRQQGNGDH